MLSHSGIGVTGDVRCRPPRPRFSHGGKDRVLANQQPVLAPVPAPPSAHSVCDWSLSSLLEGLTSPPALAATLAPNAIHWHRLVGGIKPPSQLLADREEVRALPFREARVPLELQRENGLHIVVAPDDLRRVSEPGKLPREEISLRMNVGDARATVPSSPRGVRARQT